MAKRTVREISLRCDRDAFHHPVSLALNFTVAIARVRVMIKGSHLFHRVHEFYGLASDKSFCA